MCPENSLTLIRTSRDVQSIGNPLETSARNGGPLSGEEPYHFHTTYGAETREQMRWTAKSLTARRPAVLFVMARF
jgi:hypothetical protein